MTENRVDEPDNETEYDEQHLSAEDGADSDARARFLGAPDDDVDRIDDPWAGEKRAFGRKCKVMADLLAVHRLPHSFEDAKIWVRVWEWLEDPASAAASWLDAGWTNVTLVADAELVGCSPALLDRHGITPKNVHDAVGEESAITLFERLVGAPRP